MHADGQGVKQDHNEALKWLQLAAEQGHANALKALDIMQQRNDIPTPPPGTAVTAIHSVRPHDIRINRPFPAGLQLRDTTRILKPFIAYQGLFVWIGDY